MVRKINVLNHVLVPEHILLSEEEAEEMLNKLGLNKYQLPVMYASDPVAKAIGAKPGDVVLIIRDSPTAGKSVALRYVMRG